ncbi:MAG: glycerophosphodiester phosphodiesterase family protein [Solirubrobacterales bacterium]
MRRIAPIMLGLALSLAVGQASAGAVAPDPNPWLTRNFLNIAHQGGEDEAPSSTMFAFRSAVSARGADMLELDVQLTSDGHLVVIHDDTVSRTTNGPATRPDSQVRNMTLAQVQALDAGYWFRPGSYSHDPDIPEEEFIYRGIRTGERRPPPGYTADDFRIPALREVLDTFPSTPINIEIKMPKVCDGGVECDNFALGIPTARALAALLDEPAYSSRTDLIVVSFSDQLIQAFHAEDDPPFVALAPGVQGVAAYALTGLPPVPDVAAFQVPPKQNGIAVPELLLSPPPEGQDAHGDGYAVHVWPNGEEPEGEESYARLIALGIDGYMSSQPRRLHAFLCTEEIPRPDGRDRCPGKSVPKARGRR